MTEQVAQLTRIRLEATAKTWAELDEFLLSAMEGMCETYGRVWSIEEQAETSTRDGYWGRITLRRVNT